MFAFRLSSHLRRPLSEMLGLSRPGDPLTAAEFVLWATFYRRFGFDVDRQEWASANAGAAAARAFGAPVRPGDLVPRFDSGSTHGEIMAFFDGLALRANGQQ